MNRIEGAKQQARRARPYDLRKGFCRRGLGAGGACHCAAMVWTKGRPLFHVWKVLVRERM